jgi:hypothetical protein
MSTALWRTRPFSTAVEHLFREAFTPYVAGSGSTPTSSGTTAFESLPLTMWETADGYVAAVQVHP